MFKVMKDGKPFRRQCGIDCSADEPITEQAHKDSADINKIIAKHGMDMIQKTAMLNQSEYQFDDIPGNDFQEAMNIVTKASQSFESLPSQIRSEFNNNPALFLDFVQNPKNIDRMVSLGLASAPPPVVPTEPMQVTIVNPATTNTETPTA